MADSTTLMGIPVAVDERMPTDRAVVANGIQWRVQCTTFYGKSVAEMLRQSGVELGPNAERVIWVDEYPTDEDGDPIYMRVGTFGNDDPESDEPGELGYVECYSEPKPWLDGMAVTNIG